MQFELRTTGEVAQTLAKRLKQLRLQKKWKRSTLAERSGVAESTLRRFEQTAKISLDNFLKLLLTVGRLEEVDNLLQPPSAKSIHELEKHRQKIPKRGTL